MSAVNPMDPQYVIKHDGVYLLVLLVEPLQDMPGLNDFRANIEVIYVQESLDPFYIVSYFINWVNTFLIQIRIFLIGRIQIRIFIVKIWNTAGEAIL